MRDHENRKFVQHCKNSGIADEAEIGISHLCTTRCEAAKAECTVSTRGFSDMPPRTAAEA